MIGFDDLAFRISEQEEDDRGLGRWSIITITGKNGLKTTFITCYCPVVSASPGSAYAQQLVYMAEQKGCIPDNIVCPRQMFGYDLRRTIGKYSNIGNQLIVCGDFNSEYLTLSEWFLDEGLQDIIAQKHGKMPITYQRSKKDPLDCVFGTPSIKIKMEDVSHLVNLSAITEGYGLIYQMRHYLGSIHSKYLIQRQED